MAAHRKYPWEEWFGRPSTVLVRGVHYRCSQSTMVQTIRNNASARGLSVQVTDKRNEIFIEVSGGTEYPWDEWFSGDLLLLEKSSDGEKKDFDVDVKSMRKRIEEAALPVQVRPDQSLRRRRQQAGRLAHHQGPRHDHQGTG